MFKASPRWYGLQVGHSCWIPFGYIPIIISVGALGKDSNEKDKYALGQYIVQPILDTISFLKAEPMVRADVKAWIQKTLSRNLSVVRGFNLNTLNAWFKELKKHIGDKDKIEDVCPQSDVTFTAVIPV
jgi:hypothetical protein